MTFKNDLNKSETLRSFIRIGLDKKMIKEKVVKESKLDLTPTNSLTNNILKLCTALREKGFSKFANELENKFMEYKKAQSLYETSKETGEDLVDQAHPKGSHKLEDVEGDSVIETIIDQQLKDIEIVNKKPTGKLSSKEIINAVKIALAQVLDEKTEAVAIKNQQQAVKSILRQAKLCLVGTSNSAKYINDSKVTAPNKRAEFSEKLDTAVAMLNVILAKNVTNIDLQKLETTTTYILGAYNLFADKSTMDRFKDFAGPLAMYNPITFAPGALYTAYRAYTSPAGGIQDMLESDKDNAKYQTLAVNAVKLSLQHIKSAKEVLNQPLENFIVQEEGVDFNAPLPQPKQIAPSTKNVEKPSFGPKISRIEQLNQLTKQAQMGWFNKKKEEMESAQHLSEFGQSVESQTNISLKRLTEYLVASLNMFTTLFTKGDVSKGYSSNDDPTNTNIINGFKVRVQKIQKDPTFYAGDPKQVQDYFNKLFTDMSNWVGRTEAEILRKYPNTKAYQVWWNNWLSAKKYLETAKQFNKLEEDKDVSKLSKPEQEKYISKEQTPSTLKLHQLIDNYLVNPLSNIFRQYQELPNKNESLSKELGFALNSATKAVELLQASENKFIDFQSFKDKFMTPLQTYDDKSPIFTLPFTEANIISNCNKLISAYTKATNIQTIGE